MEKPWRLPSLASTSRSLPSMAYGRDGFSVVDGIVVVVVVDVVVTVAFSSVLF